MIVKCIKINKNRGECKKREKEIMNSQAALDTLELKTPPQALRGFMFGWRCFAAIIPHCTGRENDDILQKAIFISSHTQRSYYFGCICASRTAFLVSLLFLLISACCTFFCLHRSRDDLSHKMQNNITHIPEKKNVQHNF
jgi:hypothetical protein